MNRYFVFGNDVTAVADVSMHNSTARQLWESFCLTEGSITFLPGKANTFCLGNAPMPTLTAGKEYALCVTEEGASIVGRDYGGLIRGFFALLMKIEYTASGFQIAATTEESAYNMENRMIHICVFPENDLYFIKKLVRLAGLCQFTHLVIEFWGMLKFDCLAALSWPNAFTKPQVRELLREVRELGMEPIPMFNHLGHATGSRLCYGKHVVLDQDPRLQRLFTPDGWAWDIESEEVCRLLKQIREETYELFGPGSYVHIGCDEAYYYTRDEQKRAFLPDYLRRLTQEVVDEGRRPMIWMDMLLERNKYPSCTATCMPEDVEKLQGALHPQTVMVDWQYRYHEAPIPTLMSLKDNGYDVIGAPWLEPTNYAAHVNTITEHGFFGIMLTTWHTLKMQMFGILGCAELCGAAGFPWKASSGLKQQTATLLRRVSFEGNTYADCGWSKEQIEI